MAREPSAPSFALRALVAFGWALSFHVGMLALLGAWVVSPFWLVRDAWPTWVVFACLGFTSFTAFAALRSFVLVRDPFVPPGRPLSASEHSALHDLLRELAAALDTTPPDDIYLVPDVNASVLEQRQGFFGARRRVLLLGLGLLNTSTVAELRAALAHELAHFIGGDALLAPVVARTRLKLMRLEQELRGSLLYLPFRLYAEVFLRVTQGISRQQELWADGASVRLAGHQAQAGSLHRQSQGEVLFALMLRSGVSVLVASGFRPRNLYEGLRRFEASAVGATARSEVQKLLALHQASPYDSHPPLEERLRHAAQVPAPADVEVDERLARELLDGPDKVEERVTREIFEQGGHLQLVPIEWGEAAAKAVRPALEERARNAREDVARMFGRERAHSHEAALRTLLDMLAGGEASRAPPRSAQAAAEDGIADTMRRAVIPHVASLLAVSLLRRGGQLVAEVGRPFVVRLEGRELEPDALAEQAVESPAAASALLEELARLPPAESSNRHRKAEA